MMSLTFGLFTQVSGSGPLGPLLIIKMKKKSITELGHNDLLPVYEPYLA